MDFGRWQEIDWDPRTESLEDRLLRINRNGHVVLYAWELEPEGLIL